MGDCAAGDQIGRENRLPAGADLAAKDRTPSIGR
jgi:hypothetical protein